MEESQSAQELGMKQHDKWMKWVDLPSDIDYIPAAAASHHHLHIVNYKNGYNIYESDLNTDIWQEIITSDQFPEGLDLSDNQMAYNRSTNTFCSRVRSGIDDYLNSENNTSQNATFIFINMTSKTMHTKSFSELPDNDIKFNFCAILRMNEEIHIIGGRHNSKHLVWNIATNSEEEIYDFAKVGQFKEGLMGPNAIYVPSKDVIILIGGRGSKANGIWIFSMKSKKWAKMDALSFIHWNVSLTLTSNEEYVVIAGGYGVGGSINSTDKIFVLDIRDDNEYKLSESKIKCPSKGLCHIVAVGGLKDEYLVRGWLKEICKDLNLEILPMDVISMIMNWYSQEEIHWLPRMTDSMYNKANGNHFAISVKSILDTLL